MRNGNKKKADILNFLKYFFENVMTVILLFRIVISKTGYETAQTEKRLLTQCEVDVHSIDIYMMISLRPFLEQFSGGCEIFIRMLCRRI